VQTTVQREFDPKLVCELAAAIKNKRLDEADALYDALCEVRGEDALLTFRVLITIQRGRVLEALQFVNGLPQDRCPELKAICLYLIKDPTWQGIAESLEDSADPTVRKAMRQLLQRPNESH
jgi:type III secretion protein HrpB1